MMNDSYTAINYEYALWLETMGFSDGLVYDYKFRAKDFFEWLHTQGVNHINQLTTKQIAIYFDYLQIRPNKRRTGGISVAHLNHNFAAVDKLMEFLHQMGMDTAPIPINYRIKPDKQERINKIEPFSQQEIKELQTQIPNTYPQLTFTHREAKHEQLKLIFALYYGCGLRRSEGYRLTVNDIDLDRKTIFIRKGKGYKDRIVPMNTGVYKTLEHYIYNFRNLQKLKHKRLFINTTGTLADSLQDLQNVCNNEAIRDKRLTLHILRHSIATHLLQNGMGVENIARFLGHSTLDSTQIYTHIINRS